MSDRAIDLLDVLRGYPGGIPELSRKTAIPETTLRAFAARRHRRIPWPVVRALSEEAARILPKKRDAWPLAPSTAADWAKLWRGES